MDTPTIAPRRGIPTRTILAVSAALLGPISIIGLTADPYAQSVALNVLWAICAAILLWPRLMVDARAVRKHWMAAAALALALWLAGVLLTSTVVQLSGEVEVSANQQAVEQMGGAIPWWSMMLTVLAAPIFEEVIFRHLLIGKLSRWVPVWICAGLSIALFTAAHALSAPVNPLQLVPYVVLSSVFVAGYLLSGRNLVFAIGLHALNNLIATAALYA